MQYRTDDHSNDNLNSGDSSDALDVVDSADFGKIEQTESIVHNQGLTNFDSCDFDPLSAQGF
jgi:hypothetical protein